MKPRRMTIDLAPDDTKPPKPGDVVLTARTMNRVVASRPIDSRIWCNRWHVTLDRLSSGGDISGLGALAKGGARVFRTRPYLRGERPQDVYGAAS